MKRLLVIYILATISIGGIAQNFRWAKSMGGNNMEAATSLAVDASGNVYTTGFFEGAADFDPGTGSYYIATTGYIDIFVSKLDRFGNFIWAKSMGTNIPGTGSNKGNSIAVDAAGNVYVTGEFWGTTDFDPGTGTHNLTSAGAQDIFILKLDSSGSFQWAKGLGLAGTELGLLMGALIRSYI